MSVSKKILLLLYAGSVPRSELPTELSGNIASTYDRSIASLVKAGLVELTLSLTQQGLAEVARMEAPKRRRRKASRFCPEDLAMLPEHLPHDPFARCKAVDVESLRARVTQEVTALHAQALTKIIAAK